MPNTNLPGDDWFPPGAKLAMSAYFPIVAARGQCAQTSSGAPRFQRIGTAHDLMSFKIRQDGAMRRRFSGHRFATEAVERPYEDTSVW
jgi:hypothetical protein